MHDKLVSIRNTLYQEQWSMARAGASGCAVALEYVHHHAAKSTRTVSSCVNCFQDALNCWSDDMGNGDGDGDGDGSGDGDGDGSGDGCGDGSGAGD